MKDIIYKQKGIPQRRQILYYNGIKMEDFNNLRYYNIKSNSVIQLITSSFDKSKSFNDNFKLNDNAPPNQLFKRNNSSLLSLSGSKDEKSICIFIKPLNLSQISINTSPSTNIENIKKIIKEKLGIPVEKQNLMYSLKTLEDNKSLNEYNIVNASILHLLPKIENLKDADKIIFIKTVDGKTFKFKLGALDTIKDIKNKISKEKGIPIESQRIIFNGKILEDNKSLKQYNINHESILHLVPKLKDLSSSQSNNKN